MNFIDSKERYITGLELKYCERCGGLWLRLQGDSEVYCASCRRHMERMPRSMDGALSKPRLPRPKREDMQRQAQVKSLYAVVESEVQL